MASVLIHHHPGLGDHFMCHGIVREYAKQYDRVGLFSLPRNFVSVAFMYHDLPNLKVINATEAETTALIAKNSEAGGLGYDGVRTIGFEYLNRMSGEPLEKQFYKIAGVDLGKKWSNFFVARDLERERAFFENIAPKSEYVFLHQDLPKNCRIEKRLIDKKYKIFEADEKLTKNVFDYCTIIEKAEEIHVIDSSFMFLIDCLNYNNPKQKLFVHRYARENERWKLPILKKPWQIIPLANRVAKPTAFSKLIDKTEALLLTNRLSKRITRKIYRALGWRTRSQKRGGAL